jgi:hypothetical protein
VDDIALGHSSSRKSSVFDDEKYGGFLHLIAPVRSTSAQNTRNLSAFDDSLCVELDITHSKLSDYIGRAVSEFGEYFSSIHIFYV